MCMCVCVSHIIVIILHKVRAHCLISRVDHVHSHQSMVLRRLLLPLQRCQIRKRAAPLNTVKYLLCDICVGVSMLLLCDVC